MITDYSYNCHDRDLATSQVNYGLRDVVHLGPNHLSAELAIHYIANGNDTVYHCCSLESVTILKVSKRGHCSFQINSKLLLPANYSYISFLDCLINAYKSCFCLWKQLFCLMAVVDGN